MNLIVGDDGRPLLIMPGEQVERFLAHCQGRGQTCCHRPYDNHGDQLIEFEPDATREQVEALFRGWEEAESGPPQAQPAGPAG